MIETMLHLQLSVESLDKPLLKCHQAISLKPQRKVDFENIKFSKWVEVGDGENQNDQFPFRAKFQPRIWGRLSLIIATCTSKSVVCSFVWALHTQRFSQFKVWFIFAFTLEVVPHHIIPLTDMEYP